MSVFLQIETGKEIKNFPPIFFCYIIILFTQFSYYFFSFYCCVASEIGELICCVPNETHNKVN